MISPTRRGNGSEAAKQFPIASGVLGGFGGFLDESFRRHDYLLGRRNAQAFLRWNFGLPETNDRLFKGVAINGDRWHVRDADKETTTLTAAADKNLGKKKFAETWGGEKTRYGFPIIPLVDRLLTPIEIPVSDMPEPDNVDRAALAAKIEARAKKVIATLIDVDLRRVTHDLGLDTGLLAENGNVRRRLAWRPLFGERSIEESREDDRRGARPSEQQRLPRGAPAGLDLRS